MRGEPVELAYPFCDKGKVIALHFPSVTQEKRSVSATFGSKRNLKRTKEVWLVKSGCNSCGKSQQEVETELRKQGVI